MDDVGAPPLLHRLLPDSPSARWGRFFDTRACAAFLTARNPLSAPQYFGTLTNDIVWKRIAPGVLTELKRVIPKDAKGRGQATLAQAL
ncbi:P63C domain-containing protein [Bradyrhizobium ottawaense]|uniref:P63C domain-containing protein n=2 Tax=Nitrobacteraceae TaxID=41294 RepID=A0ABY0QAM5_9BRAD|nr:P63C domain-containing protein [Bradyrhizobium ottawaense]